MSSSKTPRHSTRIAQNGIIDLCSPSPPPPKKCSSDESSYELLFDDDSKESLYDDDDDSEYEQEIGSDDSSVSSVASILDNDSLPSAVNAEHKYSWHNSLVCSPPPKNCSFYSKKNTKEKFPENTTSSKNDKSPPKSPQAKPYSTIYSSSKKTEDSSKQSPQKPKKDAPSPSKYAKSTPNPRPPLSPSSKENMKNGNKPISPVTNSFSKHYTTPESPIKKVMSSPPPTKEIYTKDQAKAVEDVLFASNWLTYYDVLKLQTNASDNDIKKGYRKLARKIHPDQNPAPQAKEAFVVISNAYDVLKSPTQKAAYDINITNDMSDSVPRPPPEQPSTSTSEYAPGTSIYNTLSVGTNVTLHNLNDASSHLNGIKGYVASFQQGQYKIKRNDDSGYIDADPLALLQIVNVQLRDVNEKVKVVSYQPKFNRYQVWRGSIFGLLLEQFIIPNGTVVHLVVNSPEYNGKFATIIGWTERSSDGADTSYYKVQLSLMKIIHVKMANVRL